MLVGLENHFSRGASQLCPPFKSLVADAPLAARSPDSYEWQIKELAATPCEAALGCAGLVEVGKGVLRHGWQLFPWLCARM